MPGEACNPQIDLKDLAIVNTGNPSGDEERFIIFSAKSQVGRRSNPGIDFPYHLAGLGIGHDNNAPAERHAVEVPPNIERATVRTTLASFKFEEEFGFRPTARLDP